MMSDLDADGSGSSQGGSGRVQIARVRFPRREHSLSSAQGDWSYRITFSSDLWTRDAAVVLDKAALTKSIHEVADAGSGCASPKFHPTEKSKGLNGDRKSTRLNS